MRPLIILAVASIAFAGCTESTSDASSESQTVDPIHVDQTFDLRESFDETWTWIVGEGMAGTITVQHIPDPSSSAGPENVCHTFYQGESKTTQCATNSGNAAVQVPPEEAETTSDTTTVFSATLSPGSHSLRLWAGSADSAKLHIVIDTNHED
jgi:hypothetical protein